MGEIPMYPDECEHGSTHIEGVNECPICERDAWRTWADKVLGPFATRRSDEGRRADIDASLQTYDDRSEFERLKRSDVAQGRRIAELLAENARLVEERDGLKASLKQEEEWANTLTAERDSLAARVQELERERDERAARIEEATAMIDRFYSGEAYAAALKTAEEFGNKWLAARNERDVARARVAELESDLDICAAQRQLLALEVERMRPVFDLAARWRRRPVSCLREGHTVLAADAEMFAKLHAAVEHASRESEEG
jgi:hypothetical protein